MSKEFDTWFSDDGVSNESWTRVNVKQDMEAAFIAGRALGRDEGQAERDRYREALQEIIDMMGTNADYTKVAKQALKEDSE